MTRLSFLLGAMMVAGCVVGPNDEAGNETETGDGDGDPGDGDGDPGDGDGEPGDGPGDGDGDPGDGDGAPGDGDGEDPEGCGGDGDGDYPGLCHCEPLDKPCFQGCATYAEDLTCDDVCAARGETCVELGCGGETAVGGGSTEPYCPGPGEYGSFYAIACSDPLPDPSLEDATFDCCCTR